MKYNVEINIFNKVINVKNVEAQNEFEAENKVRSAINKNIKLTAVKVEDFKEMDDFFGMFGVTDWRKK